jgi:PIN domain nuclease of toxin-antitoxin system
VNKIVLDASAVLALLNDEPGGEEVAKTLENAHCILSSVNLAETASRLADRGMPAEAIKAVVQSLPLAVMEFSAAQAFICGTLRPKARTLGLSLGDRACLATGMDLQAPVLMADRAWLSLEIGVDVRAIR